MTRSRAPVTPPVVLTIAGSDSGGGAGIQADVKTIEAGGAFATSAITSVTAQNTLGVQSTHVLPLDEIGAQCEAVRDDFDVDAVKTGMLATADVVELVIEQVAAIDAPVVIDPVMVAATGDRLLDEEAVAAYEALVGEATLVSPNADEAEVLTDVAVVDRTSAEEAGKRLVEMGADAALVKGGHLDTDDVLDTLVTSERVETVRHPRVDTDATHGSGCTLASAIATRLAFGDDLSQAVSSGVELLGRAVRYGVDVGEGPGAVHHLVAIRDRAARDDTAEVVHRAVRELLVADVRPLVPEGGMTVVGATPYAESIRECAAVDGRIVRTLDGVDQGRGVRFGTSNTVAAFLLACREYDADYRFALTLQFDDRVEHAMEALDWQVATISRADAGITEGDASAHVDRFPQWDVSSVFGSDGDAPLAPVLGSAESSSLAFLAVRSCPTLIDRTVALGEALDERTKTFDG